MTDIYAPIVRKCIYPLSQEMQKRNFFKLMSEADKNQYLSQNELRNLQFQKLIPLLQHSYKYVPYYRDVFDQIGVKPEDIRSWNDFRQLPILTKEQIRVNRERLLSKKLRSPVFSVSTSGSTGKPMRFKMSQIHAGANIVSRIRALRWWGINLGDREMQLSSPSGQFVPGIKSTFNARIFRPMKEKILNRRLISALDMTEKSMDNYWHITKKFNPKIIYGFPSAIYVFAKYLKDHGYDCSKLGLKAVVTSGEILFDWQREMIEEVFRKPVVDEYGSVEAGIIAYGHPCGAMHTMDDYIIVELIKSNPQDELGEVVVTPLENWGSPLIRYNLHDLAVPSDSPSACPLRLGFSKIERIIGRQYDLFRLSNGRITHGHIFVQIIQYLKSIEQYQVIQKEPDLFEIILVSRKENNLDDEKYFIRTKLIEHLGPVRIDFRRVSSIPKETSGKFRYIRSEVN